MMEKREMYTAMQAVELKYYRRITWVVIVIWGLIAQQLIWATIKLETFYALLVTLAFVLATMTVSMHDAVMAKAHREAYPPYGEEDAEKV